MSSSKCITPGRRRTHRTPVADPLSPTPRALSSLQALGVPVGDRFIGVDPALPAFQQRWVSKAQ